MDVSRARHLDLASASTFLTRASQGNDLAVRRLGIVIPKTTANVSALRREHDLATASGVKFNKQQQFAYQSALAQAKALDVQANKVGIVAEIQKRFGHQSTAFANTAKGAFQSFHEALNEFEVSLGKALLPTLTEAAHGLATFFKATADGDTVANAAAAAATSLGNAFHTVESIAKQLAPTLTLVAKPLTKIAEFAGFGGILGLVAAFKGVSLTLGLAEAAQRKYRQALALGRGEQSAVAASTGRDIGAYNALTVAVERNSFALTQNALAARRAALGQESLGGATALQGVGGAFAGIGAGAAAGAAETTAAAEKVKEGLVASSEAVVGFTADSAVLADVTRHTAKDLGEYERSVVGVKKGLGEAVDAQTRYGRSLSGSNAEQAAAAANAKKTSVAYRDLSGSADASSASLNANTAAAGRSAAALESGTVATLSRVSTSYSTLGAAGAQGAVGIQHLGAAAHGANAGLLATSNAVVSVAHHSQGLHQSFVNAGAGAKAATTSVAGLTAGQEAYSASVEAGLGPQAASTSAIESEAIAYKGLAASTDLAAASQLNFARANIGAAAAVGASSLTQTSTALEGLAARELQVGSATKGIVGGSTTATAGIRKLGEEVTETAVKTAGFGSTLKTLGKGLFEMAGGMRTLGLVGVAALAFGIFKLVTEESDLERQTKKVSKALGDLAGDFEGVAATAKTYADAISAAKTDKIARDEAALAAARARQNLATLAGKQGTTEYAEALLALRNAQDEYRLSIRRVSDDEKAAATARRDGITKHLALERDRQVALKETLKLLEVAKEREPKSSGIRLPAAAQPNGPKTLREQAKDADQFADSLHKIAEANKESHPVFARQAQDLDLFIRTLGRVPSSKVVSIFVKTGSARAALSGIIDQLRKTPGSITETITKLRELGSAISGSDPALSKKTLLLGELQAALGNIKLTPRQFDLVLNTKDFRSGIIASENLIRHLKDPAGKAGATGGKDFALAFAAQLAQAGLVNNVKDGLASVLSESGKVLVEVSKAKLVNAGVDRDAARTSLRNQRELAETARQSATDAARQVSDAQRSLADAIRSGAQSIRDAVSSANQNLTSIGSSLSDSVDQFLDAQKKTDALIGPSAKQFKDLKKQLAEGASGADLARGAKGLANQIDEQQAVEGSAADKRKERSRRSIDDLTAQFRTGAITLATFNKRVAGVLAADGITYKKAGRVLGFAFAEGFRGQVKGLAAQALAIQQGPHPAGTTGFEPSIVKPLEAVRDAQRQIKDAQVSLADSVRAQGKADKELAAAQKKLPGLVAAAAKAQSHLEDLQRREAAFLDQQAKDVAKSQKLYHDQVALASKVGAISGLIGGKDIGKSLGDGTTKGLQEAETRVVGAMTNLMLAILSRGRKVTKSHSPSQETRDLGLDLGRGLSQGLRASGPDANAAAGSLLNQTLAGLRRSDDFFRQHARHSIKVKVDPDLAGARRELDLFGRATHTARLHIAANVGPAASALDALHAREARRNRLHLQVDVDESITKGAKRLPALVGDRGTPAAIEGKPHDRVMLVEALAQKRILVSQERHLGNLVQESRRQTALLHHRKPIPKPKRSAAAIGGARLAAVAE